MVGLVGPRKSPLKLPDKLITIAPKYRRTKRSHRSGQNNTMSYYQDVTQSDDFSVSITQDTKSIKELLVGVDSFLEDKKRAS